MEGHQRVDGDADASDVGVDEIVVVPAAGEEQRDRLLVLEQY